MNKKVRLGINTGFALNRYPKPEQWLQIVGEELQLRSVQLTADLLNPSMDQHIVNDYVEQVKYFSSKYKVHVDSVMTGAFTRVNHFAHPDEEVREYWLRWFQQLTYVSKLLGATNVSSHLGILCYEDFQDTVRRKAMLRTTVSYWKRLAAYAKTIGIEYLSWEPMSIGREFGETIKATEDVQEMIQDSAIPIYLCLDVGHGDATSGNPHDVDYKKWIEKFGKQSPLIHVKQVLEGSSSHHPFTPEHNEKGMVKAEEFLELINQHGLDNTHILLEHGFREREPTDSNALSQLKASAAYWRKKVAKYESKI